MKDLKILTRKENINTLTTLQVRISVRKKVS